MNATGLRGLARRLETTFVGRCMGCFVALQGIDRAVVLASQVFTPLIPLLFIVAALAPAAAATSSRALLSSGST